MRKWNFIVKSNPKMVIENLETALESIDGLVFNMNRTEQKLVKFKIRKRIIYAWYLLFLNSIVVNGKISTTDSENETDVEISFKQHFLWKLVVFTEVFLGAAVLFALLYGQRISVVTYLFSILILGLGILLWSIVQQKFERNVKEYKTLIGGV